MNLIEYQLTERELIVIGLKRWLGRKKTMAAISLFLFVALSLFTLGGLQRFLGWIFLAGVPLLLISQIWAMHRQIKAFPSFVAKTSLEFDETAMIASTDGIKLERMWRTLTGWSESKEYFFLQANHLGTAIPIPKRAFTDQREGERFRVALKKIGSGN